MHDFCKECARTDKVRTHQICGGYSRKWKYRGKRKFIFTQVSCVIGFKMFRISAHSIWGSVTSCKQNIAIDQQNLLVYSPFMPG